MATDTGTEVTPATDRAHPQVTRREGTIVTVTVAAFALLLTVWALLVPMFQAPDEGPHFDAVLQVAIGDGWPPAGDMGFLAATQAAVQSAPSTPPEDRQTIGELLADHPGETGAVNQMSQHPPTYYFVASLLLRALPLADLRWDVALTVLRLFDALLVAPIALLAWASVRRLTRSPRVAVLAPIALFAVPQIASIGASVTNDAPVILFGGILTWLAVRVLTGDRSWWTTIASGATLGVLCSIKATGLPAILFVAVVLLFVPGHRWPSRVGRAAVALGVSAVLGAWWWVHNLVSSGTLQPNGFAGAWKASPDANDPGVFVTTEWQRLSSSFWGWFGLLAWPMSSVLTTILTIASIVVVLAGLVRGRPWRRELLVLAVFPLLTLAFLLDNNWNSYERLHRVTGSQGRYLFVAIVALVLLAVVSSTLVVRGRLPRRWAGRVLIVVAPLIGAYGLSRAYRGAYEGSRLAITRAGLAQLHGFTVFGAPVLAVAGVLLVVGVVVAVMLTWRVLGADDGLRAPEDRTSEGRAPVLR